MSQLPSTPTLFLFAGIGLILLVAWGLLAWTVNASHRIQKMERPARKTIQLIAALQIVLGVVTVLVLRLINTDPVLDLGVGLAVILLSGLLLQKYLLKKDWKPSLLTWALAAAMQLFFIPLVTFILLAILVLIASLLFPPQY